MKNKYNIDQLVGMKCTHGSPGYGRREIIAAILPYTGKPINGFVNKELWQVYFASGCFTYFDNEALQSLLKKGVSYYKRTVGFTASELIEIFDPQPAF